MSSYKTRPRVFIDRVNTSVFDDPKECPFLNKAVKEAWYALRVTYSRELALKEYLDVRQIENFIPMHYKQVVKGGRIVRKLTPVVHNLVFTRTSRKVLDEIKTTMAACLPIRYIMDRETNLPVTVPEGQMKNFIAVAGTYDEQLVYLDSETVALRKGDRVKVIGGIFAGVEGRFIRINGDRRVVVSIQGVMAIATAFIHPSLIQRMD